MIGIALPELVLRKSWARSILSLLNSACGAIILTVGLFNGAGATPKNFSTIPFVGCIGQGPLGAMPAVVGKSVNIKLPRTKAEKLALYDFEGFSFLAPRGWVCDGTESQYYSSLAVYPSDPNPRGYGVVFISLVSGVDTDGDKQTLIWSHEYFPKVVSEQTVIELMKDDSISEPISVPKYPSDIIVSNETCLLEFKTPIKQSGVGSEIFAMVQGNNFTEKTDVPTIGFLHLVSGAPQFPNGVDLLAQRFPNQFSNLISDALQLDEDVDDAGDQSKAKC